MSRVAAILALLGVAVVVRRLAVDGRVDGLLVGAAFGGTLVALALASAWRPMRRSTVYVARSVALGAIAAALVVGLALIARARGPWVPLDPAATFGPWVAVTVVVATAEELVLRGSLFDATDRLAGPTAAVLVSALAFALLHVPLYGLRVVPLDVGVGLLLGGLRLATGGVLAPAVAHLLADVAAWWL